MSSPFSFGESWSVDSSLKTLYMYVSRILVVLSFPLCFGTLFVLGSLGVTTSLYFDFICTGSKRWFGGRRLSLCSRNRYVQDPIGLKKYCLCFEMVITDFERSFGGGRLPLCSSNRCVQGPIGLKFIYCMCFGCGRLPLCFDDRVLLGSGDRRLGSSLVYRFPVTGRGRSILSCVRDCSPTLFVLSLYAWVSIYLTSNFGTISSRHTVGGNTHRLLSRLERLNNYKTYSKNISQPSAWYGSLHYPCQRQVTPIIWAQLAAITKSDPPQEAKFQQNVGQSPKYDENAIIELTLKMEPQGRFTTDLKAVDTEEKSRSNMELGIEVHNWTYRSNS